MPAFQPTDYSTEFPAETLTDPATYRETYPTSIGTAFKSTELPAIFAAEQATNTTALISPIASTVGTAN